MSVVEVAVARAHPRPRVFIILALLLLVLVVVGFGPTFFFRPFLDTTDYATGERRLPLHLVAHGLALTGWYLLFAVQAGLAAAGRVALHRRLGIAGVLIAVAVIATSAAAIAGSVPRTTVSMTLAGADTAEIEQALRGIGAALVGASGGLVLFTAFVAAGVLLRRSPAAHKRLMVLASLAVLVPALSPNRFLGELLAPFPPTVLHLALLGGLVWYDLATTRRVHAATWWGLAGNALVIGGLAAAFNTGFGLTYARWLSSFS
jgi:hypothetical protein